MERNVGQMVKVREELKDLWQRAESRILTHAKVNKYKVKAEKVTTPFHTQPTCAGGSLLIRKSNTK